MIQGIVKVKSCETLPTKDGKKTYLSAVLTGEKGDRKYSVFDPALQKTIQEAHKQGASLKIGLEKEGNFWNLKTAEITAEQPPSVEPKSNGKFYHDRHSQDAEDWTNIRTALMQAVELETHHYPPAGKVDTGRTMQIASEIFASMIMMKPKREEK